VGGQRNERRKWIHCFDNVTAVIFVTAVSEYDQVLYEDENTNRMDEALVLFDQICNHPSFKKTSMILFLNKRDLMEMKLKKKDLTCWEDNEGTRAAGKDYEMCISYIKKKFLDKNKDPIARQVYCHATCATDTNNISFVMESVFDIILKENLRKLEKPDIAKITEMAAGSGESGVKTGPGIWTPGPQGKIMLAAAWYVEKLGASQVLVDATSDANLPAVQIMTGIQITESDWSWLMGLGSALPVLPIKTEELGAFRGNFKEAASELRKVMGSDELGAVYDNPITMVNSAGQTTIVVAVVKKMADLPSVAGTKAVDFVTFEDACYKTYDKNYAPGCVAAEEKGKEFNPFAPNPVGIRWFKGICLFTKEVTKLPDKGVYLGVFKVYSAPTGFEIMVNEHNRISIPMIFLTETQIEGKDKLWMHGVRVREEYFKIDLLEGKKPNMGWLGPEMSGEEGATFPEKLWWAIDEAKARLNTESIGSQYDKELVFVDELDSVQLLLFGVLTNDSTDVLPGHIWVPKEVLEVQNMKYMCPNVLQAMINEMQAKISEYQTIKASQAGGAGDYEESKKQAAALERLKTEIETCFLDQKPLKWVNRVIMWCADKMPSFADSVKRDGLDAPAVVEQAMAKNSEVESIGAARAALIAKYMKK